MKVLLLRAGDGKKDAAEEVIFKTKGTIQTTSEHCEPPRPPSHRVLEIQTDEIFSGGNISTR